MLKAAFFIPLLLIAQFAVAQSAADSTGKKDTILKLSPVKTLSYQQYDALLKGIDLYNMAASAEANHYPLPNKVLLFKKQLDLSPTQLSKITLINSNLQRKKLEMGPIIIHNEHIIDSLFKTRTMVNEGAIIFFSNRYGIYQGELRNAILQACFATEKLLSAGQIKQLEALETHK